MATWLGITSAKLDSYCGDTGTNTCAEALDGTDYWAHTTNEDHWFIIDLGSSLVVSAVRGRSYGSYDPTDVDIYVSDSKVDWGTAVASNIATWQDNSDGNWVEISTTEKTGRYIKVVIDATEAVYNLRFGRYITPFFSIFDVQVELETFDISGTIEETSTLSGTATIFTNISIVGVITGTSAVTGKLILSSNWQTGNFQTVKRLVAVGNDKFYYENI